jgi:hypothetical protein
LNMLLLALGLLITAAPAKTSVLPLDSIKQNPIAPCLDTMTLMAKFQAGELEEVYRAWLGFFERTQRLKLDMDMPCLVQGKRMLGVLHLVLMEDTTKAIENFTNLAINAPRQQFWDLNLPYEVQAVWDSVRGEWGPELSDDQTWEDKWLPPPIFEPGAAPQLYRLRKMFHDNRVLYGLAGEKDPEPYIRILHNIENQQDPAFILMRTDAMLRLGYGPRRVESELSNFTSPNSPVVKTYYLLGWRTRLGVRVTQLASGIEKKEGSKKAHSLTTPVLNQGKPSNK